MVVFSGAEGREKNTRIGTKIGQTGAEGAVTPAKRTENERKARLGKPSERHALQAESRDGGGVSGIFYLEKHDFRLNPDGLVIHCKRIQRYGIAVRRAAPPLRAR